MRAVFMPLLGRNVFLRPDTSDEQTFNDVQWQGGIYHRPPESMSTPSGVLDLGANIGLTAAHYRALWPDAKVVAVEPDPGNIGMIRMNTDAYVRTSAIADDFGFRMLRTEGLRPEAYRLDDHGDVRVHCNTLDHAIGYDFGASVDFVKMDVEGTEWELFEVGDKWAHRVKHLLVELHPHGDLADDTDLLVSTAIDKLHKLGFDARHHPPHPRSVWATR